MDSATEQLISEEDSEMDSDRNLETLATVPMFGQLWLNSVNVLLALSDARNMLNERMGQTADAVQSDAIERVLARRGRALDSTVDCTVSLKAVA